MNLALPEAEAFSLAFLLVALVFVPVAWMLRMSLFHFIFLAQGIFFLVTALLTINNDSFCKDCGFGWSWPIFLVLYREFGHWGTHGFIIAWALFFFWIAFKEPRRKSETEHERT
jgi:branched-subunit amino acid ABC-type transport system permease component